MKIAVCDDEQIFLDEIKEYLTEYHEETETPIELTLFEDADSFLSASKIQLFDVCFLDIMMPLLNGIDAAKELRKNNSSTKLVFLTSSPEFAIDSYEVKAFNYLLKPVAYEKFRQVMDELRTMLSSENKSLLVKTPVGYQKIYMSEIEYLEALNKTVIIHLRDGSVVNSKEPLYYFEENLIKEDFFKCHRSYLVNLHLIDSFNSLEMQMSSGAKLPIARGLAKLLKAAYFQAMFEEL